MDMDKKAETWLWTISVAAVTGAASLYRSVKFLAVRHLNADGAFEKAKMDRIDEIHQVSKQDGGKRQSTIPDDTTPAGSKNWQGYVDGRAINKRYMDKKRAIIHDKGADNFSGAWDMLSSKEKTDALSFSAVASIVAGGVTYAISSALKTPVKKGRGGGSSTEHSSSCGGCGGSSSHSPSGGHSCGHGCGSGCGH